MSPTNYVLLTAAGFYEATSEVLPDVARRGRFPDRLLDNLPKELAQSIREAVAGLDSLSGNPNPRLAAGALVGRGMLKQVVFAGFTCVDDFRRALTFNPSLSEIWDVVTAMEVGAGELEAAIRLCQQRLERENTAHARFALAKVYFVSSRYSEAEQQLVTGWQREPDDFDSVVALASVVMKRGENQRLPEARQWLRRAEKLAQPASDPSRAAENNRRLIEYSLAVAIYEGLIGHLDHGRANAKAVLGVDKDNERARDILTALGGS